MRIRLQVRVAGNSYTVTANGRSLPNPPREEIADQPLVSAIAMTLASEYSTPNTMVRFLEEVVPKLTLPFMTAMQPILVHGGTKSLEMVLEFDPLDYLPYPAHFVHDPDDGTEAVDFSMRHVDPKGDRAIFMDEVAREGVVLTVLSGANGSGGELYKVAGWRNAIQLPAGSNTLRKLYEALQSWFE